MFALSDHKVQGKGLAKFILDLQKPPSRYFALENFYTMLSCTSDWEDIAILRPFNNNIFKVKSNKRLIEYDIYLEQQNAKTKQLYKEDKESFIVEKEPVLLLNGFRVSMRVQKRLIVNEAKGLVHDS